MELKKVGGFSSGTLISRFLGLGREIVLAFLFGASSSMDAFRVAFNIPNLLRDFLGEGGLNAVFLPAFSNIDKNTGRKEALNYLSAFSFKLFWILIILVGAGIILSPEIVNLVAHGWVKSPVKFFLTVRLTRIIFPFLLFISFSALFMSLLTYSGNFFTAGVAPTFFNLSVIIISVILAKKVGIAAAALGVAVGGFLQAGFQYPFLRKQGFSINWKKHIHPEVFQSFKLMIPVFLGFAAVRINVTVNMFIASFMKSGSVSYLGYAFRLMQLPLGMFGVAISSVALPELSRLQATASPLDSSIKESLKTVWLLTIPASFLLFSVNLPVIQILFQHGHFSYLDAVNTSRAFSFYIIGVPFLSGAKLLQSIYYAKKDVKTPMTVSYIVMGINIIFAVILSRFMSFRGLAFAASISAMFQFFILAYPYRKLFISTGLFLVKMVLFSIIGIIPAFFLKKGISSVVFFILQSLIFLLIFLTFVIIFANKDIKKYGIRKRNY